MLFVFIFCTCKTCFLFSLLEFGAVKGEVYTEITNSSASREPSSNRNYTFSVSTIEPLIIVLLVVDTLEQDFQILLCLRISQEACEMDSWVILLEMVMHMFRMKPNILHL